MHNAYAHIAKLKSNRAEVRPPDVPKESLTRPQFRLLLVYLRRYCELVAMFDDFDTNDDQRVNLKEFKVRRDPRGNVGPGRPGARGAHGVAACRMGVRHRDCHTGDLCSRNQRQPATVIPKSKFSTEQRARGQNWMSRPVQTHAKCKRRSITFRSSM